MLSKYRDHPAKNKMASDKSGFLGQCTVNDTLCSYVDFCTIKCDYISNLLSYLKEHIREGMTVSCPFRNCDKRFLVVSKSSSYSSGTRKKCSVRDISSSMTSDGEAVRQTVFR